MRNMDVVLSDYLRSDKPDTFRALIGLEGFIDGLVRFAECGHEVEIYIPEI
jgi:hypothetical protein